MSVVMLMALAAAKRHRDEALRRARQHRMHSSNKSNSYGSYYKKPLSTYDCVLKEIEEEDSTLLGFFDLLITRYNEELYSNTCKYTNESNELERKMKEVEPLYIEFVNKMKEKGLDIEIINNNRFIVNDEYKYNADSLEDVLIQMESDVQNTEQRIIRLTEEKKELEERSQKEYKRAKYSLFKRKEKKEIADKTQARLDGTIIDLDEAKKKVEILRSFIKESKDNKDSYENGLCVYSRLKTEKEKVDVQKNRYINLTNTCSVDYSVMKEAYRKALEDKELSKEELDKVFLLLDQKEDMLNKDAKKSEEYRNLPYDKKRMYETAASWFIYGPYEDYTREKERARREEQAKQYRK